MRARANTGKSGFCWGCLYTPTKHDSKYYKFPARYAKFPAWSKVAVISRGSWTSEAPGSRPAASQPPACPVSSAGPPRCRCPAAPAAPGPPCCGVHGPQSPRTATPLPWGTQTLKKDRSDRSRGAGLAFPSLLRTSAPKRAVRARRAPSRGAARCGPRPPVVAPLPALARHPRGQSHLHRSRKSDLAPHRSRSAQLKDFPSIHWSSGSCKTTPKFQHNKDLTDRRMKAVEDAGAFRAPTNAARSFNPQYGDRCGQLPVQRGELVAQVCPRSSRRPPSAPRGALGGAAHRLGVLVLQRFRVKTSITRPHFALADLPSARGRTACTCRPTSAFSASKTMACVALPRKLVQLPQIPHVEVVGQVPQKGASLSLEGVSQMAYILPERLPALVRPAFDLVLRRIRSLKRCAQA